MKKAKKNEELEEIEKHDIVVCESREEQCRDWCEYCLPHSELEWSRPECYNSIALKVYLPKRKVKK